jgi:FkbM family methyltransferase
MRIRGKGRLLDRIVPKSGERLAEIFGAQVRLDLADHMQRWIYFGIMEPSETSWVKEWLGPGMTVVDVGANVGYYTLLAASYVGVSGKVLAIEPSPYAYGRLQEAVAANGLSQVVTLRLALGSTDGEMTLYSPPSDNHTPSMIFAGQAGGIGVQVSTLDNCLKEWNVEVVDLLKLDVEGFEPQILAGALPTLKSGRIRAILCELNDWWLRQAGSSTDELAAFIESNDFVDAFGSGHSYPEDSQSRFFVHRSVHAEGWRKRLQRQHLS